MPVNPGFIFGEWVLHGEFPGKFAACSEREAASYGRVQPARQA